MAAPLRTPTQVAEDTGFSEHLIRRLCRERKVEHVRAGRGRILLSPPQVTALVAHLTIHPEQPRADVDLPTPLSRARRRRTA